MTSWCVTNAGRSVKNLFSAAAYGGLGWSPRQGSLRDELGSIWGPCGVTDEWSSLRAVLLHRPGAELEVADPAESQMIEPVDVRLAQRQHDALADAFQSAGVRVHYVDPDEDVPPNLMFVADLMFMTAEGAILARPASTVRAGEERFIARRLAELGIPILLSVHGEGTFEGADAAWIDPETVLLATGLRTNARGAAQVAGLLEMIGVEVIRVGLPYGTMHLMGQLRLVDRDLAVGWPGRVPHAAVEALRARGFKVLFLPEGDESRRGMALNVVTLGPRSVLMPGGNPVARSLYEEAGISCQTVDVSELVKAAGGIGCLTGVLERASSR